MGWNGNARMPQPALGAIMSINNNSKIIILALVAIGLSVLACRAYTYQVFSIDLVSFVPPFGKIVGSLLTFPFIPRQAGQFLG